MRDSGFWTQDSGFCVIGLHRLDFDASAIWVRLTTTTTPASLLAEM
jgi:hypothetical protein